MAEFVQASNDANIDGLLGRVAWTTGTGNSLTYGFPTQPGAFDYSTVGFTALTTAQEAVATTGLRMIESFTNLTFVQDTTPNNNADGSPQLRFGRASNVDRNDDGDFDDAFENGTRHFANGPGNNASDGDAWFTYTLSQAPLLGTYDYATILHEIGHTLGLKHPHDIGGPFTFAFFDGTSQTYNWTTMPTAFDAVEYTVMSYNSYVGYDEVAAGSYAVLHSDFPQSYMLYDIAALQWMYGADYQTNDGNTWYSFDPNTGAMFIDGISQGTPGANFILRTIWDGGGNDTYDFGNYTTKLDIDLAPGGWINLGTQLAVLERAGVALQVSQHAHANIANALLFNDDPRSLIENAVGGSNDDTISGNQAANILLGKDGRDILLGFDGNDFLDGGVGDDWMYGGNGNDTFIVDHWNDLVLDGGTDGGFDQVNTSLSSFSLLDNPDIEALYYFGSGTFNGVGNGLRNFIQGGARADRLEGRGGDDFLSGGGGRDTLLGGDDNDRLFGEDGNDRLFGGDGNDEFIGGLGNDTINGEAGVDTVNYSNDGYGVVVDLAAGRAVVTRGSSAETDTLRSIENVVTSFGNDVVTGSAADNKITVTGGFNAERIAGGFDTYDGGGGIDTVDFSQFDGQIDVNLALNRATSSYSAPNSGGAGWIASLSNIENVVASKESDVITGDARDNTFFYTGIFIPGLDSGGFDRYEGGLGDDTVDFSTFFGRVSVDLVVGLATSSYAYNNPEGGAGGGGFKQLAALSGIENIVAGFADDVIVGDRMANTFTYVGEFTSSRITGGFDDYAGGEGVDTVDFSKFAGRLSVDLVAGLASSSYSYTDPQGGGGGGTGQLVALSGIENVVASLSSDAIVGDGKDNGFIYVGEFTRTVNTGGFDHYSGGDGSDTVDFSRFITGDLTVDLVTGLASAHWSYSDAASSSSGSGQIAILTGVENVAGTAGVDVIAGNGSANTLFGNGGADNLRGRGGADVLTGGAGADTFVLESAWGNDTITDFDTSGGERIDVREVDGLVRFQQFAVTSEANGTKLSFGGDSIFLAGVSASAIGARHFVFAPSNKVAGTGAADVLTGTNGIDIIRGLGGNDVLIGLAGGDVLEGGAGRDTLIGGLGVDTLDGGAGIDTADYKQSGASVAIDLTTGTASGGDAEGDILIGIENVIGSVFGDRLRGDVGVNVLQGDDGDDRLLGVGGNDTLYGGAGNDVLEVSRGDIAFGDAGVDELRADATTIAAGFTVALSDANGIEILTGNSGNDILNAAAMAISVRINGGDGSDRLTGGSGNDALVGGSGADTLVGGAGFDTADYSASNAAVTIDLRKGTGLGGDAAGDTLVAIERVVASAFKDQITGSNGADVLDGGAGDDLIIGGDGIDTLIGGGGNDVFIGDQFDIYSGGSGSDQVNADPSTIAGGFMFRLTSEMSVEAVQGHNGNDMIDASGMVTSVTLVGGLGDDLLVGGSGQDTLIGDAYSFAPGGNDVMHGGAGSDQMFGFNGDDIMYGDGSDPAASYGDRLWGGAGNDILFGGGSGWILGEDGNDTLTGGDLDTVDGGAGNDTIVAAAGTQYIDGGTGDDLISGGGSADLFVFMDNWGHDVITDFRAAEGDHLEFVRVTDLKHFAQLTITNAGDGADVSFGAASIHLAGYTADQIQANWISFF